MHFVLPVVLPMLFGPVLAIAAQSLPAQPQPAPFQPGAPAACPASALPKAANTVATLRRELHAVAVGEFDPAVPAPVVTQITQLKTALAAAAEAAVACVSPSVTPEALENTLASAPHANLTGETETVLVTRAGKDLGAYGSDLAVQVFPLATSPRTLEINFRFGIECGDDNLLLVFRQENSSWREILRWGAPAYTDVSGALGDFILLTPITGLAPNTNWRAVVAHGQPGCAANNPHSHFDLDLLQPTADPDHPTIAWHFERPYRRGDTPRLATTEATLTFELLPPAPDTNKVAAQPSASTPPKQPAQIYRFRISNDNQVTTIDWAPETATPSPAPAASRQ